LFASNGNPSNNVEYALSKALEYNPSTPSIITTNFSEIAIFLPSNLDRRKPAFERVSIPAAQLALSLRIICAAYLLDELPSGLYISTPPPDLEVDENMILPQGPPQGPDQPLLSDQQVFATHHRASDFDRVTLVRDRGRALQFFRWNAYVRQRYSKLVAHPDDTLTAVTGNVGIDIPDMQPLFPLDRDGDGTEIPLDTEAHLKMIQRKSTLIAAGIAEAFERSKSFALRIQNVVAEGTERGICTVYRCQITSIDDAPLLIPSPSLCLKLLDDRFQPLKGPNLEEESEAEAFGLLDEHLPRWFDRVVSAEWYALNEASGYDKLRAVQGSIVPWFYGTHQVNSSHPIRSRTFYVFMLF